jgi:hypothetical protein
MSNVIDITGNWKVKTITKFLSTLFSHGWGGMPAMYMKLRTKKPRIDPGSKMHTTANSDICRCSLSLVEGT